MATTEHIDGPRAQCPGCQAQDALHAEALAAAREQLASTDPTDGHLAADYLARLILKLLGVEE